MNKVDEFIMLIKNIYELGLADIYQAFLSPEFYEKLKQEFERYPHIEDQNKSLYIQGVTLRISNHLGHQEYMIVQKWKIDMSRDFLCDVNISKSRKLTLEDIKKAVEDCNPNIGS